MSSFTTKKFENVVDVRLGVRLFSVELSQC